MPPPPSQGQSGSKAGWLIAGVVVVVLAIGAAVLLLVGGDEDDESAREESSQPDDPTEEPEPEPDDEDTTEETTPVEPDEDETAEPVETDALAIGESTTVGETYEASVDAVELDADATIARASEFNSPAKGRYVMVTLTTEYLGTSEGTPWIDLTTVFVGSDARQYDTFTCSAQLPQPAFDVPTLESGGTATYQVCFDVPVDAIEGGQLFIEELASFDEETRVYWSIQ